MPTGPIDLTPLTSAPVLRWTVPGSKSITNRALVLAALSEDPCRLEGVLESDDTQHMQVALDAMGVEIRRSGPTSLEVRGGRGRIRSPRTTLFVGNSGTTVRFLTAFAATVPGEVHLEGDAHMAKRPIADLADALTALGVPVRCPTGCPPISVAGAALPAGRVRMRGDRSSQYFSALLMAGCAAEGEVEVEVVGDLVSQPYVAMTAAMIAAFGGEASVDRTRVSVVPKRLSCPRYDIEPDASAASYAFATAAATGGVVTVPGLGRGALQGDVAFADILAEMGCDVRWEDSAITVRGGALRGVDVDMEHISDTVMTLAALAPLADGPTHIRNVGNIRLKETDRLHATVTELRRLGQDVEEGDDWLRITPRPVHSAAIECYADHRMAMSFAVLGLARPGVTITDPRCVAKTYPGFWRDLAKVYAAAGDPAPAAIDLATRGA